MKFTEIINKKTGAILSSYDDGDFEYQNPNKFYEASFTVKEMIEAGISIDELSSERKVSVKSLKIYSESIKKVKKIISFFESFEVPEKLLKILDAKRKKNQEDLLKGFVLTPKTLMSFMLYAGKNGYTLSQYSSEYYAEGIDMSKMPLAYRVKKDGEVQVFGETELSDGQLKQALNHRKVKIAKILDKGDEWHCFFATYKSLSGEETWLGEKQPHYHYISNLFGLNREKVISEIKSKEYKLGNLPHIKLEEYGNQPIKK